MSDGKAVVVVSQETHERIRNWVNMAPGEASWVGIVTLGRDGGRLVAYVDDVVFLKQWGTPGGTTIDPKELMKWMEGKGYEDAETTPINLYWGHSHVNMGCFWSTIDEECIESFLQFTGSGVVVSVVYNKKNEFAARMDVNVGDFDDPDQWTQEAGMVVQRPNYGTAEQCEKEIKELLIYGRPPERDLSDPRIKELQDREDAEERERRGKQIAAWNHRGSTGGGEQHKAYEYTLCKQCPAREYCATPVISPKRAENGGCTDKTAFTGAAMLLQVHWDDARRNGTERQLQSWRDKAKARMAAGAKQEEVKESEGTVLTPSQAVAQQAGEHVEMESWKLCEGFVGGTFGVERCKAAIYKTMVGFYEYGKCALCCKDEGTVIVDGIKVSGPVKGRVVAP